MRAGTIVAALASLGALPGCAGPLPEQGGAVPPPAASEAARPAPSAVVYACPVDEDIRSLAPGTCQRCGRSLVATVVAPVEYRLDVAATPPPRPNAPVRLRFEVYDPWKGDPVTRFTVVHEAPFHAFIVSRDLEFFLHDHPAWRDGAFEHDVTFPRPGMYRVLGDFHPEASIPQLITRTLLVAGEEMPFAPPGRDYSPKQAENLRVELATTPEEPIAGVLAQFLVTLGPSEGIEPLMGAWGHMLAASDDLIDMIHTHPFPADGGPRMRFSLVFPRARTYRVWLQFQRGGVVNTAHFDIPVREMPVGPLLAANSPGDSTERGR